MRRWIALALLSSASILAAIAGHERSLWPLLVLGCCVAGIGLVIYWRSENPGVGELLVIAFALRLLFLPMPSGLSDDIFRYTWDGLIQIEGVNPYAMTPSMVLERNPDTAAASIYEHLNSKEYYSVYPPVSQLAFLLPASLFDRGMTPAYFALKLLFILLEFGALLVASKVVAPRRLMLYAWNPLVVLEVAGQPHTEAIMLCFLLLAFTCYELNKYRTTTALITLAAFVKIYPILLLPFLFRRIGWKRHVWIPAVVAAPLLLLYYESGALQNVKSSLDLYVTQFEYNAGIYYAVKWLVHEMTDQWFLVKVIGPWMRWAFLAGVIGIYLLDSTKRWHLARVSIMVLGLYLALATTIHPWYFLAIMALIPFQETIPWHWIWLGIAAIGTYLFYSTGVYAPFVAVGWIGWLILLLWPKPFHHKVSHAASPSTRKSQT